MDRRHISTRRQFGQCLTRVVEKRISADHERSNVLPRYLGKRFLQFTFLASVNNNNFLPDRLSRCLRTARDFVHATIIMIGEDANQCRHRTWQSRNYSTLD